MNKDSTWKTRLKTFSDEVFRNYLIVRKRWEISALERKRNTEITDLGNRTYRLIQMHKLESPELDSHADRIRNLDTQILEQEERLREIVMRADLPKQLPDKIEPHPASETACNEHSALSEVIASQESGTPEITSPSEIVASGQTADETEEVHVDPIDTDGNLAKPETIADAFVEKDSASSAESRALSEDFIDKQIEKVISEEMVMGEASKRSSGKAQIKPQKPQQKKKS